MGQILCCISQKAQLQQYSIGREGREEQRKALWCSQLLCATAGGKVSTSIDQRSLRSPQSYRSFKISLSHWGMYNSKQSPESEVAPSTSGLSFMPSVTCKGEHKATPASCSHEGMTFRPSVAQHKLLGVARAFAGSPSLRKEIHFISVNLAV